MAREPWQDETYERLIADYNLNEGTLDRALSYIYSEFRHTPTELSIAVPDFFNYYADSLDDIDLSDATEPMLLSSIDEYLIDKIRPRRRRMLMLRSLFGGANEGRPKTPEDDEPGGDEGWRQGALIAYGK
jgi:hypothetical protein